MENKIQWYDDDKRLLQYTFSGCWNTESALDTLTNGQENYLNTVTHHVDVILDFRQVDFEHEPLNLIRISHYLRENPIANLGRSIIVSQNKLAYSMLSILQPITGKALYGIYAASTLPDALKLYHSFYE